MHNPGERRTPPDGGRAAKAPAWWESAWVPAAIVVGAAALRAIALGRGEPWHDECCSILMTFQPEGVWKAAASPGNSPDGGNPPLYFALLDGWIRLFGLSATAVRSLSLVLSAAQIGALGWFAREAGASRTAALGAMVLAAVSPLHVFYGTEARAYALLLLFLTIALGAFFRAMRTGQRRDWALHGAALLLAWYTHNLAVPFTAAFWGAAFVLRGTRNMPRAMLVAHAAALVLYAPWIPVLMKQAGSGLHEWIQVFWKEGSPLLLIPKSMEAMFVGGKMPVYLSLPDAGELGRALSTILLLVAAAGLLLGWRAGKNNPSRDTSPREIAALTVFFFAPLLFLLAYSLLKTPLYLVGRYDLPAEPAFVVLAAVGLERTSRWFRRPRAAQLVIAAAIGVAAFLAHRTFVHHPKLSPAPGAKAARGELIARNLREGDVVVCTGFTTAETWVQLRMHGKDPEVATYPPALLTHLAWYDPEKELARGENELRSDARALLARTEGGTRIWLVVHPTPGRGAHAQIMEFLLEEMEGAGMRIEFPPGEEDAAQRLGVGMMTRP